MDRPTIRLVIAEDDALARRALRAYVHRCIDLDIVAEVGDGLEALSAVRQHTVRMFC